MHVHAQALVAVRQQDHQEWLVKAERHREAVAHTADDASTLTSCRLRIGRVVPHVMVMFQSLRSMRRSKLA